MYPLGDIAPILASIAALIGVAYSFLKLHRDQPVQTVDVARKYQEMAAASAMNEKALKQRIDDLESRLDGMETQLIDSERYIAALDTWAAEVLAVLQQLGITTVKPKPERKPKAVQ